MEILNTPEVEELRRRVAETSQAEAAKQIGVSEAMVSRILTGKRTLQNETALRKLGFTRICYTARLTHAPQIRKAIKEIVR